VIIIEQLILDKKINLLIKSKYYNIKINNLKIIMKNYFMLYNNKENKKIISLSEFKNYNNHYIKSNNNSNNNLKYIKTKTIPSNSLITTLQI
jgi:hypothetical protein